MAKQRKIMYPAVSNSFFEEMEREVNNTKRKKCKVLDKQVPPEKLFLQFDPRKTDISRTEKPPDSTLKLQKPQWKPPIKILSQSDGLKSQENIVKEYINDEKNILIPMKDEMKIEDLYNEHLETARPGDCSNGRSDREHSYADKESDLEIIISSSPKSHGVDVLKTPPCECDENNYLKPEGYSKSTEDVQLNKNNSESLDVLVENLSPTEYDTIEELGTEVENTNKVIHSSKEVQSQTIETKTFNTVEDHETKQFYEEKGLHLNHTLDHKKTIMLETTCREKIDSVNLINCFETNSETSQVVAFLTTSNTEKLDRVVTVENIIEKRNTMNELGSPKNNVTKITDGNKNAEIYHEQFDSMVEQHSPTQFQNSQKLKIDAEAIANDSAISKSSCNTITHENSYLITGLTRDNCTKDLKNNDIDSSSEISENEEINTCMHVNIEVPVNEKGNDLDTIHTDKEVEGSISNEDEDVDLGKYSTKIEVCQGNNTEETTSICIPLNENFKEFSNLEENYINVGNKDNENLSEGLSSKEDPGIGEDLPQNEDCERNKNKKTSCVIMCKDLEGHNDLKGNYINIIDEGVKNLPEGPSSNENPSLGKDSTKNMSCEGMKNNNTDEIKEALKAENVNQEEKLDIDEEYSCLMISNSQLDEIENNYYRSSLNVPLGKKYIKTDNVIKCNQPIEGTENVINHNYINEKGKFENLKLINLERFGSRYSSDCILPIPPKPLSVQWPKNMGDMQKKIRELTEEVDRLNSLLMRFRKEIWPQKHTNN